MSETYPQCQRNKFIHRRTIEQLKYSQCNFQIKTNVIDYIAKTMMYYRHT